ncbi:MAG: hypothetical protein GX974_01590 [Clostridiales bacterium]|nr:hypothetical protein [Clostridiales bacterium]
MDISLVMKVLDNAVTTQKPGKGLIIHSDRGSQYTSKQYREIVKSKGFIIEIEFIHLLTISLQMNMRSCAR